MSVRHLDVLFAPRSVAVVGVSAREGNLGAIVLRNLRSGGFAGPVWAVNKHVGEVEGTPLHAGVESLPAVPDLAVICTPPASVPEVVQALARIGTRAAIVLTAGLKERLQPGGPTLEQAMLDAARPSVLRILGPNCVGPHWCPG
jgi:acetyltransferase